MELLFASEYLLPALGGAERFVLELAEGLEARGHGVRVLSLGGALRGDGGERMAPPDSPADVPRGNRIVLPDPAPDATRWHRRRLWRETLEEAVTAELARRPAEAVVGQLHTGPAAIRAAQGAGVRSVLLLPSHEAFCAWAFTAGTSCVPDSGCRDCPRLREQTEAEQQDQLLARREQEWALADADLLVAPSRALAATCEAWCGRRPAVVAPLVRPSVREPDELWRTDHGDRAAGAREHQLRSGPSPKGPVVLVTSQWTPGKGADLLVPLARALAPRRVRIQWSALAPPPAILAELERAPNVDLIHPPLPLPDLLADAGVVLVPSQAPEAFGRIAVEGMAAGVPVLASGIGGLRETVPATQLVRPHDDPAAWVAAVRRIEDPGAWAAARDDGLAAAASVCATDPVATVEALLDASAAASTGLGRKFHAPSLTDGGGAQNEGAAPQLVDAGGSAAELPGLLWMIPHAYHPSGVADEARAALRALEQAGLAPAARNVDELGDPAMVSAADRALLGEQLAREPRTTCIAIHHYRPLPHRRENPGTVNVARPVWETDRIPPEWREPLSAKDEVWVSCQANLEAFAHGGIPPEKLRLLGQTLDFRAFRPGLEPWPLDVPPGRMVFLSSFDFSERKGWRQLLLAWVRAFEPHDPVALVLKTGSVRELRDEEVHDRIDSFLRRELGGRPHALIQVLAQMLPADAIPRLYAAADAYVSASRGEAWGRTRMEALACGLPAIGTRFGGGAAEWMEGLPGTRLVGGELVPVSDEDEILTPLYRGHRWGEADVDELATALRAVAADPSGERDRAAAARPLLIDRHGPDRFANRLNELARAALGAHEPRRRSLAP